MLFHHNQHVSSRRFGQRILNGAVTPASELAATEGVAWRRVLADLGFFLFLGLVGWVLLYSL
jgi:hypothetical protein